MKIRAAMIFLIGITCFGFGAMAQEVPIVIEVLKQSHRIFGKESSLWDIFLRGGIAMWPILLAAVVGLTYVIERFIEFRRSKHAPKDFDKDVIHVVDTRGVDAGLALCLEKQSSLGRLLYAALLRHGSGRPDMETAIRNEAGRVRYDLLRNTRLITSMSILAPLFGIAGSIVALILSFDQMAATGYSAELLLSGIAEALLPIAFGVLMAIPLVYMNSILRAKADDIVREIDERAVEAIVTLDRKARQSIRLIDDIQEHIATKDMPAMKEPPPDLVKELEPTREGSGIKSSITTHVGLPIQNPGTTPAPESKK